MGMVHPKIKGGVHSPQHFVHQAIKSTVNITVGRKQSNGVVIPTPPGFFEFSPPTTEAGLCRTFLVATNYHVFKEYTGQETIQIFLPILGKKIVTTQDPILCAIFPTENLALLSFELNDYHQQWSPVPAQLATVPRSAGSAGSVGNSSAARDATVKSGEDVFVVGYNYTDTLKVTDGVYSGWDLGKYDKVDKILPVRRLGRMNITADFHVETPGGGVFSSSDGLLQGITDSYIQDVTRTSTLKLAIPITVLVEMISLLKIRSCYDRTTTVVRTPLFGFCTRPVEGGLLSSVNARLDGKSEKTVRNGVVVTKVLKKSTAKLGKFEEGDVITSVKVGDISYDLEYEEGQVKVDWAIEPVPLFEMLLMSPMNKPVEFKGWKATGDDFSTILDRTQEPYIGALKTVYAPFEKMATYDLIVIQVAQLCMNHLDLSVAIKETDDATYINGLTAIMAHVQDTIQESHLIIYNHDSYLSKDIKLMQHCLLKKIDGVVVSTIEGVIEIHSDLVKKGIEYFKITFWDITGYHDAILPVIPPRHAET
jgi:hypothetical protein